MRDATTAARDQPEADDPDSLRSACTPRRPTPGANCERRAERTRARARSASISTPLPRRQHENIGCLVGRLVETYTEVVGIEIQSVASTTFKRKDLQKAFEADESYYIEHAEQIRPKEELDLTIDPPPDLVIEIEITSSAIRKLKLFAAMGVPEVWRHDGERLQMYVLSDGQYVSIDSSNGVPGLTAAMIDSILEKRFEFGETALVREFRNSLKAGSA